jgi:hypothetical protein
MPGWYGVISWREESYCEIDQTILYGNNSRCLWQGEQKTYKNRIIFLMKSGMRKRYFVPMGMSIFCLANILSELDYLRAINEKSPLHVIKEVKDGKSSYPELFATMCK